MNIKLPITWEQTGYDEKSFSEAVSAMDDATELLTVSSDEIGMAAIVSEEYDYIDVANFAPHLSKNSDTNVITLATEWRAKVEKREDAALTFLVFEPGKLPRLSCMGKSSKLLRDMEPEHYTEFVNASRCMWIIDKIPYILSPLAWSTLLQRVHLGGSNMLLPSVARVQTVFTEFQFKQPQTLSLVVRKHNGVNSIIGVMTPKYAYMPQSILADMYQELAKDTTLKGIKCDSWAMRQEMTRCYVDFPQVAKEISEAHSLPDAAIPGVYFGTSDSGDSSLIIKGYWKVRGHRISLKGVTRKHIGDPDIGELIKSADTTIFPLFRKLPERLCELLTIDVKNPQAVIKSVFKQAKFNTPQCLGGRHAKALAEELAREFTPGTPYTAYDIAMAIMTVPERITNSYSFKDKLEDAAYTAMFADFNDPKEVEIVLS